MDVLEKFKLKISNIGNKQSLQAVTDYPLTEQELLDNENESSCNYVMKKVTIVSYDRNKYCRILYKGELYHVKSGYLYHPKLKKRYWSDGDYTYSPYSHNQLCQLPDLDFID